MAGEGEGGREGVRGRGEGRVTNIQHKHRIRENEKQKKRNLFPSPSIATNPALPKERERGEARKGRGSFRAPAVPPLSRDSREHVGLVEFGGQKDCYECPFG